MTRRHDDYEEVVADALLGLVQAARAFDSSHGNKFITYASEHIRGAILDGFRARSRRKRDDEKRGFEEPIMLNIDDRELGIDPADLLEDTEAEALANLVRPRLWSLVDKLPERYQRLIRRRYVEGIQSKELARLEGISDSRMSQLTRKALNKLVEAAAEENLRFEDFEPLLTATGS